MSRASTPHSAGNEASRTPAVCLVLFERLAGDPGWVAAGQQPAKDCRGFPAGIASVKVPSGSIGDTGGTATGIASCVIRAAGGRCRLGRGRPAASRGPSRRAACPLRSPAGLSPGCWSARTGFMAASRRADSAPGSPRSRVGPSPQCSWLFPGCCCWLAGFGSSCGLRSSIWPRPFRKTPKKM